jgi:hypothetical protein
MSYKRGPPVRGKKGKEKKNGGECGGLVRWKNGPPGSLRAEDDLAKRFLGPEMTPVAFSYFILFLPFLF